MQVYMSIPGVSNAPRMSNIHSTHLKPVAQWHLDSANNNIFNEPQAAGYNQP